MGKPFDKEKIFSAKEIELIYRVRESTTNDQALADLTERALDEIQGVRPWLLMCRCPYTQGSFLGGGDKLTPQSTCRRDTNKQSHGIRVGIAPWNALVRTFFEDEAGTGPTPAGDMPPRYGEWPAVPANAAAHLARPQTIGDPWGWRPWDGVS